ncbi:CRISPR-associated protein Cas4 [Actinokineospora auranticolor]|uniref:CRISPR-associated exonuclease Cas4 n=1 Tax=Actinokineospora auranticolor TaxID=155976 RepID=A0A2S6GM29_9PSEU|nr:CRISPR-associated protein Cas4 [Actinokineospora auranticolor]PPK66223.1 CRISPR-associated exonuclease Cas4 [Actinokineospora auranticolor]
MISKDDVGGVHIKYLYHCPRQLWLYARGIRPEHLNDTVRLGEAVHDTSYTRHTPVNLGAARLDFLDGRLWGHEVKSSNGPTQADEAQGRHYCHRLRAVGIDANGTVLHYPKTRRTHRHPFTDEAARQAQADIESALTTIARPTSPDRLPRRRCVGCSRYRR